MTIMNKKLTSYILISEGYMLGSSGNQQAFTLSSQTIKRPDERSVIGGNGGLCCIFTIFYYLDRNQINDCT